MRCFFCNSFAVTDRFKNKADVEMDACNLCSFWCKQCGYTHIKRYGIVARFKNLISFWRHIREARKS